MMHGAKSLKKLLS